MRLSHRLEFAGVRAVEALLAPLSWERASDLGAALGGASRFVLGRRWRLTLANLAAAFPEKPQKERERIALEAWRNAGRFAAELARAGSLSTRELERIVRIENPEVARDALAEGKGVLVNIGHLGNWEVGGFAFTHAGFRLGVIGRAMKNPLADAWLKRRRELFGFEVFAHKNPFFQSVRWLKQGGFLAILIDHNIRRGGVFVPFLGRPAATSTLTGLLAVKLGCPIVSCTVRRDGAKLSVRFSPPLRADPAAPSEAEAERLTVEMTRALEDFIRERPEDWLWGHNRWRRAPESGDVVPRAAEAVR